MKYKKRNRQTLSYCTSCKGRSKYIKMFYEKNMKNNMRRDVNFNLLNYNSEDDLHDYVMSNLIKYIEKGNFNYFQIKNEDPYYRYSGCKNIVHYLSNGHIICNLDSETIIKNNFTDYVIRNFDKNDKIIIKTKFKGSFTGTIAISRKTFLSVGGYDESFDKNGYGYEDKDFTERCMRYGCERIYIPKHYLDCYENRKSEKIIYQPIKNTKISVHKNKEIMETNNKNNVVKVENKERLWISKNFGDFQYIDLDM